MITRFRVFLLFFIIWRADLQILFHPEIQENGNLSYYVNEPTYQIPFDQYSPKLQSFPKSNNLLFKGTVLGQNSILGLALYKNFFSGFRRLVGSLRSSGYDGHIILGINPHLPLEELEYLKNHQVTLYAIEISECHSSALNNHNEGGIIRGKCSSDIPDLKLEWGRYEMARRWLLDCETCQGWSLVLDTRDIFFQGDPFRALEGYPTDVQIYFVEEISPYTCPVSDQSRSFVCGNPRNFNHIIPCYGHSSYHHYTNRPVLNSGTVFGTRNGMLHFLSVLVTEFYANNAKDIPNCKSPSTTDQWTMNWLYYNGKFGLPPGKIKTLPWGVGPVLTAGKACMTKDKKTGARDLVEVDNSGRLINRFDRKIAAGVHQFDRCYPWIASVVNKYE